MSAGLSSLSLAFGFAFGFAFGEALRSAAGAVGRMHDTSGDPLDDTSVSGAGGSAGGACLRVSKAGDIVLVDSAVGAPMLVSDASMIGRVDFRVGADNVRTAVPGADGDVGPLLADGRSKSVTAGKA